jgi:L-threonylcarbamoyladenylate synthase
VVDSLEAGDPGAVTLAAAALARGWVVALPTDTVYGLAADPSLPGGVAGLFALKERPGEIPLPVLVGSRDQVGEVAEPLDAAAGQLAERFWPGPLTLVVPRRSSFVADLGGPPTARSTVGVRLPDHLLVRALCEEVGPLAVTSANRHGSPPATTAHQVRAAFPGDGGPVLIIDGGACRGTPSTVVECRDGVVRALRQGAISWAEIAGDGSGTASEGASW